MIGDDESHLSVRQHGSLRAAGRARGEKEPAGSDVNKLSQWLAETNVRFGVI
jgi:hypothetical protein